jgi:predicted phosphodiesterase
VRYAVLSDIHANPLALDAVLRDIEEKGGADGYLVLGDLVAQGHDPIPVVERLAGLPNARFVRGNTDRYVCARDLPSWIDLPGAGVERLSVWFEAARSHAWTTGCLAASGWLPWVSALPLEDRFVLPDGSRALCVHAAPGLDDGDGISPLATDEAVSRLLKGCEADIVLVGHTHWPFDRLVGGVRVVNPGSVSYPWAPDLRGSYAFLDADASGHSVSLHRVAFDIDAVIASIRHSDFYPNPEWLVRRYTNAPRPPWDTAGG